MPFSALADACDTHFHIPGPTFPVVVNTQVPNVPVSVESYLALSLSG